MSDESSEQMTGGGLIYVDVLIITAICGGLINLYLFIRFLKYRHRSFLSSRYPQLIIVYCSISLITSIIVLPLVFHYEIKEQRAYGHYMEIIAEFFEELFFMILLSIIVSRSYLLYFDYNFAQATVDQNWRDKIVSNEQNVWLKYRNSYGNIKFVVRFLFAINGIFFIGFSCVTVVVVIQHNVSLFHYFTVFGIGPLYTICIVYLLYKIRRSIHDTFFIKKEITFLSTFVIFRMIALLIDIIIAGTTHHHGVSILVFFTVEVLTQFTSVLIQSYWVLNKLKHQNNEEWNMKTCSQGAEEQNVSMIDLLTHKLGFESLVRHCVNELSVENVLFCVEIAQFRYYLQQNALSGKVTFENNLINVNQADFVECVNYDPDDMKQQQFNCMINGISTSDIKRYQEAMMSNKYVPIASHLLSSAINASVPTTQSCNIDIDGGRVRATTHSEVEPELYTKSMFDYVYYLYTKYINNSADLCVNIPFEIRDNLIKVFGSGDKENVFKYIESLHDKEDNLFVETYLYHIFDAAFADIWNLLKSNSFVRFRYTKEYADVVEKIVADKSV